MQLLMGYQGVHCITFMEPTRSRGSSRGAYDMYKAGRRRDARNAEHCESEEERGSERSLQLEERVTRRCYRSLLRKGRYLRTWIEWYCTVQYWTFAVDHVVFGASHFVLTGVRTLRVYFCTGVTTLSLCWFKVIIHPPHIAVHIY